MKIKFKPWEYYRLRDSEIKAGAIDENKIYSDEIYGDADLSKSKRLIDFVYEHGEGSMFKMQNPD